MYVNKSQIVITVGVLFMLLVTVAGAQERKGEAAITTTLLQYQGRLTDPITGDSLPDGSYTMVFRLYSATTAGTPLWTESKDVPVQGGLFSTVLGSITPLDLGIFNGQGLWLGIKVGTDEEMVPRQQILPVAYALSLVPGAEIEAAGSSAALNVRNTGSGPALDANGPVNIAGNLSVSGSLNGGAHNHSAENIASGTLAEPRIPGTIARDSEVADYISDHAANSSAHHARYTNQEALNAVQTLGDFVTNYEFLDHVYGGNHHERYTDAEAVNAIKNADGSGSGLDADLLDGQHVSDIRAMLPIAFGHIQWDGLRLKSTSNVTSSFNPANYAYEIAISGIQYDAWSYVTIVTPVYADLRFAWVPHTQSGSNGKLLVWFTDSSGNPVKSNFHFVTFKP